MIAQCHVQIVNELSLTDTISTNVLATVPSKYALWKTPRHKTRQTRYVGVTPRAKARFPLKNKGINDFPRVALTARLIAESSGLRVRPLGNAVKDITILR